MDVKGAIEAVGVLHGAMTAEEQAVFEARLAEQFGLVAREVGTVSVAQTTETTQAPETELEKRLSDFLNPNVHLDASDQLATMSEFYTRLGIKVPGLIEVQMARLESRLVANPTRRVLPVPLMTLEERKEFAESVKDNFPKNVFNPGQAALWTPDNSWTFAKLLDDPEMTIKDGRKFYGMRYKAPNGEVLGRATYTEALIAAGQAVEVTAEEQVWTFPVMDVQIVAPRTNDTVANLHSRVSATNTPEALIAMQLLHQSNGTPNGRWEPDIANEAIYEVDKNGKLKTAVPVCVAGVFWDPDDRRMNLVYWYTDYRFDRFGVRAEESGI